VRAALLEQLPALTRFYGLKPWDFDRMTLFEVSEYLSQLRQYRDDTEKANREANSGR